MFSSPSNGTTVRKLASFVCASIPVSVLSLGNVSVMAPSGETSAITPPSKCLTFPFFMSFAVILYKQSGLGVDVGANVNIVVRVVSFVVGGSNVDVTKIEQKH